MELLYLVGLLLGLFPPSSLLLMLLLGVYSVMSPCMSPCVPGRAEFCVHYCTLCVHVHGVDVHGELGVSIS